MDCSTPGFPVHHKLQSFLKLHWVGDAIQIISSSSSSHQSSRPLLLLPSIIPRKRVFSNESVVSIRWPKYCSFSFNISPSNEYSGLISFRMDWLDLLAVQGTLKSVLFEPVLMRWMKLEPIIQSEVIQKGKEHYSILTHIYVCIYIWNLERW